MKPTCCNRPATPFRKTWRHSFIEGYRCKRCGRVMIPFRDGIRFAEDLDAIREAGIDFDRRLEEQRINRQTNNNRAKNEN